MERSCLHFLKLLLPNQNLVAATDFFVLFLSRKSFHSSKKQDIIGGGGSEVSGGNWRAAWGEERGRGHGLLVSRISSYKYKPDLACLFFSGYKLKNM